MLETGKHWEKRGKVSARLLGTKQRFNKERFQIAEIYEVLAARMRKLITALARKNKRTARMLANGRKYD